MKAYRKKVCIQGLGFVGFAMAVAVANARDPKTNLPLYEVIGIDLDNEEGRKKITAINNGEFPISCNDKNLKNAYINCLKEGNFKSSFNLKHFEDANYVIVDINLDVSINGKASSIEFTNFKKAIESIALRIPKETLVIIETTVPPGTTEKIVLPILKDKLSEKYNFDCIPMLAHSYERVMPGPEYLSSIINFWRVFAGINKKSSEKCKEFLSTIININQYPMSELSSTTSSELSKILENSYRATNIAFIHEWGIFAEKIGVDLFEIINAIKIRPTHSNINRPGLGVGGYCLTKDPLMGYVSSRQIFNNEFLEFPLTEQSVNINKEMPYHTFDIAIESLKARDSLKSVLILGLSYRDQVGDTRYSASIVLANMFIKNSIKVDSHDPMVKEKQPSELGFLKELPLPNKYGAIIFTVGHKYYKDLDLLKWLKFYDGIVIDSNNVLNKNNIDNLKKAGVSIKIVGRGDI